MSILKGIWDTELGFQALQLEACGSRSSADSGDTMEIPCLYYCSLNWEPKRLPPILKVPLYQTVNTQ